MNIRKLAFSILNRAVQHAPFESQEWGWAMLHEMEFVEGDWAALRWAIGGAFALTRGCNVPMSDLSEVPARMESLEKAARRQYRGGYVASFIVIAGFAWFLFHVANPLQRVGCVFTIVGSGFLIYQLERNRRQRKAAAEAIEEMPTPSERYRALLERLRDFHCGRKFWSRLILFLPGPLLFLVGFRIAYPQLLSIVWREGGAFLALGALAIPLNLKLARKYERQIEQLDRLEERENEDSRD